MPKFFVDLDSIKETEIRLTGDNFNHIKNVLRLNVNDKLLINNRQGQDYKCIISDIREDVIIAHILECSPCGSEPSVKITLFQSLIKGEKMDWVIQKAVEIGVSEIVPLVTSRCVVKLETDKKTAAKCARWNKIAEAAAKQSGRGVVPKVLTPMHYKEALNDTNTRALYGIIPYEKEEARSIKSALEICNATHIALFIGPEGGFSEEEIELAFNNNVLPITFGKRILRSETASLVGLTTILYEMGEMM